MSKPFECGDCKQTVEERITSTPDGLPDIIAYRCHCATYYKWCGDGACAGVKKQRQEAVYDLKASTTNEIRVVTAAVCEHCGTIYYNQKKDCWENAGDMFSDDELIIGIIEDTIQGDHIVIPVSPTLGVKGRGLLA